MLPAAHRLIDSDAFRVTVRKGRRCGSRTLVVHLAVQPAAPHPVSTATDEPARVGFVVSKAVGNAVVRNRVKRRLRHLTRELLPSLAQLPGPAVLVVRALPGAAAATHAELATDLRRCLAKVTKVMS